VKTRTTIQLQTEKNMQIAIEKHIIPVLMEEIKNFRKLRANANTNQHTFNEYIRLLTPFPVIVLRKFNQKYGVKLIALKNLRQILRYAEALRSRSLRD
jgi:hypothetical protein